MPIIIKEIQVKATVQMGDHREKSLIGEKERLKNEIIHELKDFLRKEHLRKYER